MDFPPASLLLGGTDLDKGLTDLSGVMHPVLVCFMYIYLDPRGMQNNGRLGSLQRFWTIILSTGEVQVGLQGVYKYSVCMYMWIYV